MSNAGNLPPAGYNRLPAGVKCRCINLWRDISGALWCCKDQPEQTFCADCPDMGFCADSKRLCANGGTRSKQAPAAEDL